LQRMALLQALPDLPRDDAEQDETLATLAARFTPEQLQLCYQIAIMGRRDLDYAPDARGGFEMALLRMLAFRPETAATAPAGGTPARGASGAAGGAPARTTSVATAREASGGTPSRTSTVATASDAPIGGRENALSSAGTWAGMLAGLDLQGPARQLAAHCVPTGHVNDLVRLRLDPAGEMFRRPQLEQKLAQALSEQLGRPLRIEISVSDAAEDTPARRQAQASDERLRAAEEAIEADPAVRAMREVFGATVQPGSVKPLN